MDGSNDRTAKELPFPAGISLIVVPMAWEMSSIIGILLSPRPSS